MRKVFTILSLSAFLVACSSGPEKTAKNFTENLSKGKVEEAKKYATESTGKMLDFASGFGGLPIDPNFKFEFIKDSIVDNRAWVTFTDKSDAEYKVDNIELVKIDGDWLVHMDTKK